ncbi:MAG: ABC transporter substrate-binding protein, partial [Desulfohalobium sp.]
MGLLQRRWQQLWLRSPHIPIVWTALGLAGIVLLAGLGACGQDPIRIGFAVPLTGVYSDLGVHGRNGATLAVEEINDRGGIHGRSLRLLPRDDGNSAAQAKAVDRELIDQGVVAIIGHMTSSQSV